MTQRGLVDVPGLDTVRDQSPRRLDELGAATVVEGNPEIEPVAVGGRRLELGHLCARRVSEHGRADRRSVYARPAWQFRQLAVDRLAQDLHQLGHLVRRARPVLRREGVHGQRLDAEVDRRLDGAPKGARALPVTGLDRETAALGPAAVAVHDDRDVARDRLGAGCPAGFVSVVGGHGSGRFAGAAPTPP